MVLHFQVQMSLLPDRAGMLSVGSPAAFQSGNPLRITIHILVTELHRYTSGGVAADSREARSVEYDETILVRTERRRQFTFLPPSRPPGRFHREIHRARDVSHREFPLLAGIYQQNALKILFVALSEFIGVDEPIPAVARFRYNIVPGWFLWRHRSVCEATELPR